MTRPPRPTSTVAEYLRGIDFPRSRDQLVDYARRQGAADESLDLFIELPDGEYHNMAEVFAGVREEAHRRAAGPHPQPVPPPRPAPEAPPPEQPAAFEAASPEPPRTERVAPFPPEVTAPGGEWWWEIMMHLPQSYARLWMEFWQSLWQPWEEKKKKDRWRQ